MAHVETAFQVVEFHYVRGISMLAIIALSVIIVLVVGVISQSRRNAAGRTSQNGSFNRAGAGPSDNFRTGLPNASPVGVCQRCRSALSVDAAYCARCGLPVTRPTPLPMPRQRTQPGNPRWAVYAVIALLGAIGFGTFLFYASVRHEVVSPPTPPAHHHAPSDAW